MKSREGEVSIVILTKNAGPDMGGVLQAISEQEADFSCETIVIDSGSEDETLEIAKKYSTRFYQIKPEEFHHSLTRNLGVSLSRGKYVVFLTQDACPASRKWLKNLLRNFSEPDVVAVYGRHLPRADASLTRRFALSWLYPDRRVVTQISGQKPADYRQTAFSNVNSAVRKELLLQFPFPEELIMGEDRWLAKQLLENGHKLVYDPEAAVFHSHNYRLWVEFQRYFDIGVSFATIWNSNLEQKEGTRAMVKEWLAYLFCEAKFLVAQGAWASVPYAFAYELTKMTGFNLGKRAGSLPVSIKKRLSMGKHFWDQARV